MPHRFTRLAAVALVSALALTGCSTGASAPDEPTMVTFRLWDETVAEAYEDSFAAFEDENPGIDVEINLVPWEDYWTKLRTDVASESMDDVFWVNNSFYGAYADSGNLVDIDQIFGEDARATWEGSVVEQFVRDGTLWGVPQLYDAGVAVYYNTALIEKAGLSPADLNALAWSPKEAEDSFLPAARALTLDAAGISAAEPGFDGTPVQYGTNLAYDLQAILLPFVGSNGGVYQEGDRFAFAHPKTVEAFAYLADAINTAKVAPPADVAIDDSDFSRDAFINGTMAMFQSGLYNLKNISDGAAFDWGVASIPQGPAGRVSVTNGVVAAGNAASAKQEQIRKVLAWLGSKRGVSYLGKSGAAAPALQSAQAGYVEYWEKKGVSVKPFFDVIEGAEPIPAPSGAQYGKGFEEFDPIFREIFTGAADPAVALQQAEDAANAAIGD